MLSGAIGNTRVIEPLGVRRVFLEIDVPLDVLGAKYDKAVALVHEAERSLGSGTP